ncbi:hypothetical protein OROGR_000353 [Orobanche gracilis]
MDSPHEVMSPHKRSCVFPDSQKQSTSHHRVEYPSYLLREIDFQRKESTIGSIEECVGALEVHVHQARDIHNICIYQKQDIYAKLCLTSDPEKAVSTKTIEKAGHSAVFDEKFLLNVGNLDSSLKCEIWMLSRCRRYLEDQLLGFALVPVSEILLHDGKLEKEFSLSSTDLLHSPAGFVELSVSYVGGQPEVIPIPAPLPMSVDADSGVQEKESIKSLSIELDNIEFPDPKIANENHQMVEEYKELCTKVESHYWDGLVTADNNENLVSTEVGTQALRIESPPSSVSTTETSFASVPVSFGSSGTPEDSNSPVEEHVLPLEDNSNEKTADGLDAENNVVPGSVKPLVSVSIDPEPQVVQQDIVDMYMKSMQQFTESLAKMKLPVDYENCPSNSENSTTENQKTPPSNKSSRVFYGSRAFF